MIQNERVKNINNCVPNTSGKYIMYWMQAAQRMRDNHALEFAIQMANKNGLPLMVAFVIMPQYKGATTAHYRFMLEGMDALVKKIRECGAQFMLCHGDFNHTLSPLLKEAFAVVMDVGYTHHQRAMRQYVKNHYDIPAYTVETNSIVPVEAAYPKEAYAAYAIRSKLMKQLPYYAISFESSKVLNTVLIEVSAEVQTLDWQGVETYINEHLKHLEPYRYKNPLKGGEDEALTQLSQFVENDLCHYGDNGNRPEKDATSRLSAYLHFGQISPITIYEAVQKKGCDASGFIEQLVVRRELSFNFTWYNPHYDGALSNMLPQWALDTLNAHRNDKRLYHYDLETFENAKTHDVYWNAAQRQLLASGFMHNHMRMYWGKKVIEWSKDYEEAYQTLLYLNDKYQLDGRDPNGYAGVAWCFGKFDRPFTERSIFGKIRYMNAEGLKRKFHMDDYVKKYPEPQ